MKLYVLYEQTCNGESNHRYFISQKKAHNDLCFEIDALDRTGLEIHWKLIEVETED